MSFWEGRWIKALRRGEPKACQRLVHTYTPSLYAFFRGLGVKAPALDDLLQETFVALWRSFPGYEGKASLKTWVFLIARRTAWKFMKREMRVREQSVEDWESALPETTDEAALQAEDWVWLRQRSALLRTCVDALSPNHREVLLLHYMEEMSLQEIAKVLEIAKGTVKSRLSRALRALRDQIQHAHPTNELMPQNGGDHA